MKAVLTLLTVFLLIGGLQISGYDSLFASEETESESDVMKNNESEYKEVADEEKVDSELEGIEDKEEVDINDYIRILNEEGQEENPEGHEGDEHDNQSNDPHYDDEKEYPDDKFIDDRG